MSMNILIHESQRIIAVLALIVLSSVVSKAFAAAYELEIIQPRAGLNTENRFYKAYPGIEYNVRLAVIGGDYPFRYALNAAPSGMTINENTGEIIWSSPVVSNAPYNVTASVTDGENTTKTVSWSITATTTGFKFVDSTATDDAGAGTIGDPWKTLPKITGAASSDFIYFRDGDYASDQHQNWDGTTEAQVWLAYPNETPVLDLGLGTFFFINGTNKLYIDGLTLNANNNAYEISPEGKSRAINYAGGMDNITIRRNTFYGMNDSVPGQNPSYIFCTGASFNNYADYNVIQDNIVTDGNSEMLLAYGMKYLLVEDNTISGMTGGKGMNLKDGISYAYVRGNDIQMPYASIAIQSYTSKGDRGPIILEFNNLNHTTGGEAINVGLWTMIDQPLIVHRNTVQGRFYNRTTDTDQGPSTFSKNVIINDSDLGHTDRIRFVNDGGTPVITYDDNLVGGTSSNIVDAHGNLSTEYRSYVGTHGWQIGNQPLPPSDLSVAIQ